MNHLHLNLITDKRLKRQISILDIFQHYTYPLTLEEIANDISVTTKTVRSDIQALNDLFPPKAEIKSIVSVGAQLHWKANTGINDWLEQLIEKEPLFIVVEKLFNNEIISIEDWADELFLSDATMRKHLRILSKQLHKFNLKLSFSPISIIGSEADKRLFFFHFFRGFSNLNLFSGPEDYSQIFVLTIHNLITQYQENLELELHLDINRVTLWLKIVSTRISLNQNIKISEEDLALFFRRKVQKNFSSIFVQEAQNNLNIPLSKLTQDEQLYFYAVCIDSFIYNGGLAFERRVFSEAEDKEMYLKLSTFSRTLMHEFHFDPSDALYETKILATINALLRNIVLLTKITPLFQKNSFDINQQIKHMHPMSYEKCLNLVSSSTTLKELGIKHYEDVSVSIIMLMYSFIPAVSTEEKSILFSLTGESTYINYVMTLAKSIIPSNIRIYFDTDEQKLPSDFKPTICIYNQNIQKDIPDCVMIRVPALPKLKDWTLIYNLITDISSKEFHNHFEL